VAGGGIPTGAPRERTAPTPTPLPFGVNARSERRRWGVNAGLNSVCIRSGKKVTWPKSNQPLPRDPTARDQEAGNAAAPGVIEAFSKKKSVSNLEDSTCV
jgi:hypothetical protein